MDMMVVGGAVAALVVLAVIVVLVMRRGKAKVEAPVVEEPARRRTTGSSLIAGETPAEPLPEAPPRARAPIGLSPWNAEEVAAPAPSVEEEIEPEEPAAEWPLAEPDAAEPFVGEPMANPLPEPPVEPEETPVPEPLWNEPAVEAQWDEPVAEEPAPVWDEPAIDEPTSTVATIGDEPPSILSQLSKKKKKGGANPLAGAIEDAPLMADSDGHAAAVSGAAWALPAGAHAPREVEETVSLVLRRQVPVRAGEGPRSWIGGLPMMPAGMAWPRAVAPERPGNVELPLNFVAQLALADMPEELWGGVGPREGWLLFFLNPRDESGDDERIFRVLYTPDLGAEATPPADLPPVAELHAGSRDFPWVRGGEEVPGTWRRWPVDLVAVPNQAYDDGYRIVVTPKDFAGQLYGAEAEAQAPDVHGFAPFSWRGALYVVDSIIRRLGDEPAPAPIGAGLRDALARDGFIPSIIPELRAREEHWLSDGEGAILRKEDPLRERERELRDRLIPVAAARKDAIDRLAQFIATYPNADAIAARIDDDSRGEGQWRADAAQKLAQIRTAILEHPLDSALSDVDWAALRDHLSSDRHQGWSIAWTSRNSDFPVAIEQRSVSLLDLAGEGLDAAVRQVAADYQANADLADLVPPELAERLEPHWRHLTENRPHRVGGFHDGIQSDPEPGAQPEVLLLQLASDEAMGFDFGDGGAYYFWISPTDLASGRLGEARIQLEHP